MSRWKAAGIHVLLSAVVIGTIGAGLIYFWYGWDLFRLTGGQRLLAVLAACDVTIGPLLTLIVYKAGKKSLKFDLAVIALLQVAFMAYGLNTMRESRPVFLVGVFDRFELVFAGELTPEDLAKGKTPEFSTLSLSGPRIVGGQVAQNSSERLDLALSGMAGKDIHLMPDRYVPYEQVAHDLALKAEPARHLMDLSPPEARQRLERALAAIGRDANTTAYLPITSRRGRATMLVEVGTGTVLGTVGVDPWPDLESE